MTPAEQTIIARMQGREWMSAAQILGPDGGPERVRLRDALLALVDRGLVATAQRGLGTHAWWEYALSVWWRDSA